MLEREVSKQIVAEMLEVTVRMVSNYEKREDDPLPVLLKTGQRGANIYDPVAVCHWRARQITKKNEKDRLELQKKDDQYYDLDLERGRLTHHQADKVEIEKRKMLGELLEAEEVAKEWERIILAAKAKILAMPSRYAHRVLSFNDLKEANNLFREIAREVLNELGEGAADEVN